MENKEKDSSGEGGDGKNGGVTVVEETSEMEVDVPVPSTSALNGCYDEKKEEGQNEGLNAETKAAVESKTKTDNEKDSEKAAEVPMDLNTKKEVEDENDDANFVVLEEDDGEDDDDDEGKGHEKKEEAKLDADAILVKTEVKTENEGRDADKMKNLGGEGEMLVNPLFGKPKVSVVPLVNIESSGSSDESEDFSEDVEVSNFQVNESIMVDGTTEQQGEGAEAEWKDSIPQTGGGQQQSCSCNCFVEKGILVNEIERLRKAVFELSERHAVLEDYVEVEFGESFDKFLKNREHLVKMGFGGGNSNEIDGKRSSKSAELIELLKMIKEQAADSTTIGKSASKSSSDKPSFSGGSNQGSSQNQKDSSTYKKTKRGSRGSGNGGNQQPRSKPIPTLLDRTPTASTSTGRGGAMSYSSRPILLHNSTPIQDYQYQQQLLAQRQQTVAALHYYNNFDNMYANVISGGPSMGQKREVVTAVGRTSAYGYNPMASGAGGSGGGVFRGPPQDLSQQRETKKQRKRKRKGGEASSEASVSSTTGAPSTKTNVPLTQKDQGKPQTQTVQAQVKNPAANKKDDDDIVVIDYEQNLNPNSKRICPVCSKIIGKKGLRDHLLVTHQGQKIKCPVCREEFYARRRLQTHMKHTHDLPMSEYSVYIEQMFEEMNRKVGPWVDQMMKEARVPTIEQVMEHVEAESAKREQNNANKTPLGPPNKAGSSMTKAPVAPPAPKITPVGNVRSGGGGSSSGNSYNKPSSSTLRYFNSFGSNVGNSSSSGSRESDMYGPGGYAQYAAKYLQQRSAMSAPPSRLYTPF